MLPYYLYATILVVGALIVGGLFNRTHKPGDAVYGQATGTPSAPQPHPSPSGTPLGVHGNAPWALSALPECFVQLKKVRGPYAFVGARLPRTMRRIPAGYALKVADCTLHVGARLGVVDRGTEHLVIPPDARFYSATTHVGLLRRTGNFAELRLYRTVGGFTLSPDVEGGAAETP